MRINKKKFTVFTLIFTLVIVVSAIQMEKPEKEQDEYTYVEDEYEKFLQEKVLPDMIKDNNEIHGCELEEGSGEKLENVDLGTGLIEIDEVNFIDKLDELHSNLNKYIGRDITYEGLIYKVEDDENPTYVIGRYIKEVHGDHEHENFFGLQGIYDGQWPETDTWVKVKGKVSTKEFNGEVLPAIDIEELVVQSK